MAPWTWLTRSMGRQVITETSRSRRGSGQYIPRNQHMLFTRWQIDPNGSSWKERDQGRSCVSERRGFIGTETHTHWGGNGGPSPLAPEDQSGQSLPHTLVLSLIHRSLLHYLPELSTSSTRPTHRFTELSSPCKRCLEQLPATHHIPQQTSSQSSSHQMLCRCSQTKATGNHYIKKTRGPRNSSLPNLYKGLDEAVDWVRVLLRVWSRICL